MALFRKKPLPPTVGYRLIEPCERCGRSEGLFNVPWPDLPRDRVFTVCARCLWGKFHELPKGPTRRALVRKVFGRRALDPAG
jgi:hypothetical protein